MTNHIIDNSASVEFGKTILWQYDNAINLRRIIGHVGDFYDLSVREFWDNYPKDVIGIDTATGMGLTVWGRFVGVSRPMYMSSQTGSETYVSDDFFRRIIKSRFFLMKSTGSISDMVQYMAMLFPCFGTQHVSQIRLEDHGNMAMTYEWNDSLGNVIPRVGDFIPAGQIVSVPKVYNADADITSGTEWDSATPNLTFETFADQFVPASTYYEGTYVEYGGEVFKIITESTHSSPDDYPDAYQKLTRVNNVFSEGVAAESSVSHIVTYFSFEDFTWTGSEDDLLHLEEIHVADYVDEEVSPIKASPKECSTPEEKDIFETFCNTDLDNDVRFKGIKELFPFPAGVKDNNPIDEVVFGFAGQERKEQSPEDNNFGDTHVDVLKAKDGLSELQIRAGVVIPSMIHDPDVGSFVDPEVQGSWNSTVFISSELQEEI